MDYFIGKNCKKRPVLSGLFLCGIFSESIVKTVVREFVRMQGSAH